MQEKYISSFGYQGKNTVKKLLEDKAKNKTELSRQVSQLFLTLSGQVQEVCLHVLNLMLQDVAVELKDGQDVLGESGGRRNVWRRKVAPVNHLTHYDANHWREKEISKYSANIQQI